MITLLVFCIVLYGNIGAGDFYKYAQPLSPKEFCFFHLKDDCKEEKITVFETENLMEVRRTLQKDEKNYIIALLHKMNPSYQKDEKISQVHLSISDREWKKEIQKLEEKIGAKTAYGEMLTFYSYEKYSTEHFGGASYEKAKADFELAKRQGIAGYYARCMADGLGFLMGILPIFFAVNYASRDRKYHMNEMLYVTNTSSLKLIGARVLAVVLPFFCLLYLFLGVSAGYFYYCNQFYGYDINYLEFFGYSSVWVIPTILVVVASTILFDLLFGNLVGVVCLEVLMWIGSVGNAEEGCRIWQTVLPFDRLSSAACYDQYKTQIDQNRWCMFLVSVFCVLLAYIIFVWNRNYGGISVGKRLRKVVEQNIFGQYTDKKHLPHCKSKLQYQLKNICSCNFIAALIFLVFFLKITYTSQMSVRYLVVVGESILILLSLFVFLPIGDLEGINQVEEFVYTSNTRYTFLLLQRFWLAAGVLFVLVEGTLCLLVRSSQAEMGRWAVGVYLSALTMGTLYTLVAELTGKRMIGILCSLFYYFASLFLGKAVVYISLSGYTNEIQYSKYRLAFYVFLGNILLVTIAKWKENGGTINENRSKKFM